MKVSLCSVLRPKASLLGGDTGDRIYSTNPEHIVLRNKQPTEIFQRSRCLIVSHQPRAEHRTPASRHDDSCRRWFLGDALVTSVDEDTANPCPASRKSIWYVV